MATGPNLLTGDSVGFEGGTVGNWGGQNTTVANSTAQAHSGSHSLAITASTNGGSAAAYTAVGIGITFLGSFYERAATNTTSIYCQLLWFDAAFNVLGSVASAPLVDSATSWTLYQVQGVPVAGTVNIGLYCSFVSTTPGDVHYLDDAFIGATGSTPTFRNWRMNSLSSSGLPMQTVRERSLAALSSLVSGQNPDGTIKGS